MITKREPLDGSATRRPMRLISFSMTTKAFLENRKTVTRRLGWGWLTAGTRLEACRKAMGLKKGEKVERYGEIEVVSVRREQLNAISQEDVLAEGFDAMAPEQFVERFCKAMGCQPDVLVTRIEFKRI